MPVDRVDYIVADNTDKKKIKHNFKNDIMTQIGQTLFNKIGY